MMTAAPRLPGVGPSRYQPASCARLNGGVSTVPSGFFAGPISGVRIPRRAMVSRTGVEGGSAAGSADGADAGMDAGSAGGGALPPTRPATMWPARASSIATADSASARRRRVSVLVNTVGGFLSRVGVAVGVVVRGTRARHPHGAGPGGLTRPAGGGPSRHPAGRDQLPGADADRGLHQGGQLTLPAQLQQRDHAAVVDLVDDDGHRAVEHHAGLAAGRLRQQDGDLLAADHGGADDAAVLVAVPGVVDAAPGRASGGGLGAHARSFGWGFVVPKEADDYGILSDPLSEHHP